MYIWIIVNFKILLFCGLSGVLDKIKALYDIAVEFILRSFTSARNFSVHMKKHRQSAPGTDPAEFNQAVKLPYPALSSVF